MTKQIRASTIAVSWSFRGMFSDQRCASISKNMKGHALAFVNVLSELVHYPSRTALKRVPLDAIDVLSLTATASWNVNFLMLDGFLRDLAFKRRYRTQRAWRINACAPIVVLVAEFQRDARGDDSAVLMFAECGKYRASAAFFEDAVAFTRSADIVTYQLAALDEADLLRSSLYAVMTIRNASDAIDKHLPPAA